MENTRVLIVDDSFFMRKVIKDILQTDKTLEIVGEAADGNEALQKIAALRPTVVTLDIEMPGLNGLETLRAIMASPTHPSVVMVSGYAEKGADITLQCLALGAADFVLKPSGSFSMDMDKVRDLLLEKVKTAAAINPAKLRSATALAPKASWQYRKTDNIIVIGASTGGPAALETLLPQFPADFPYPIVVAQHLPKTFAQSFTERLQKKCQLKVVRASQGLRLSTGTIYIAVGGTTTTVVRTDDAVTLEVEKDSEGMETPSVDMLMSSAAEAYPAKTIGVILTGMGKDGLLGIGHIKQSGGHTIVQDEPSSAVFGMGYEVVHHGLADHVVPLSHIMVTISEVLA